MAKADYNPDREGHAEHRWEVIKATTKPLTVELDGKEMKFGRDGAFRVSDPGMAAALRQKYADRGDVTVTRIRTPQAISDRGHRYFFGQMPEMPWKKVRHGEENQKETSDLQGEIDQTGGRRVVCDDDRRADGEGDE